MLTFRNWVHFFANWWFMGYTLYCVAFEAIFTLNEYQSSHVGKWYCLQYSYQLTLTHRKFKLHIQKKNNLISTHKIINYLQWLIFLLRSLKIPMRNFQNWTKSECSSRHPQLWNFRNCNVQHTLDDCCCCRRRHRRCRRRCRFDSSHIITGGQTAFFTTTTTTYTHISRGVWQFRLYTHFSLSVSNAAYTIYIKKKKNERKMAARRQ